MENKKYNPFKMWGSWVGAVVGLVIYLWGIIGRGSSGIMVAWDLTTLIIYLISGFLLGWGIHSLIRRLRK